LYTFVYLLYQDIILFDFARIHPVNIAHPIDCDS